MNNPLSEKVSFWDLILKTKIEIPIIQRDYAQGREDKWEIRNSFLDALYNAINEGKPIELDFVYGSNNFDCLKPLDGQQRLTTLFLLHWYISYKENIELKIKDILKKFTYETRTSSREFCNDLISQGIDFAALLPLTEKNNQISTSICDASWFFLSWVKDPTIKAMLNMLDAIHERFKDSQKIWEKLTTKNIITFQFIELENFGLSDDLYIKMNARGKPLTEFENFKAKFEQHISNNHPLLKTTVSKNIDGKWTDLFWNYRDDETDLFDDEFMNFFKVMATNHYALKYKLMVNFESDISLLRNKRTLSFNKYLELNIFDEAYTKQIIEVLNKMSDGCSGIENAKRYLPGSPYLNEEALFKSMINDELAYAEMVIFYAYAQFLNTHDSLEVNDKRFSEWMRVIRNLVEGSKLIFYGNVVEYASSIESINKLLIYKNDILNYLVNVNDKIITGFAGIQIEEERLKAKLFCKGEVWETVIIDIENHEYFKGQIDFILNFSGIKGYYEKHKNIDWNNEENEFYLSQLTNFIGKAKVLFNNNGLIDFGNFLFERALLAKGDYLLTKGQNHSFLINSDRDISWKRLLRDDNNSRRILQELFNSVEVATVKSDLKNIVEEFSDKEDWRYYFIKYPEIIGNCGSNKLIRWNTQFDILLLAASTTSGYHSEYYSYALFITLKHNSNIKYSPQRSINYDKSFSIGKENLVKVKFFNQKYQINREDINSLEYFKNQETAITYLTTEGFLSTI